MNVVFFRWTDDTLIAAVQTTPDFSRVRCTFSLIMSILKLKSVSNYEPISIWDWIVNGEWFFHLKYCRYSDSKTRLTNLIMILSRDTTFLNKNTWIIVWGKISNINAFLNLYFFYYFQYNNTHSEHSHTSQTTGPSPRQ